MRKKVTTHIKKSNRSNNIITYEIEKGQEEKIYRVNEEIATLLTIDFSMANSNLKNSFKEALSELNAFTQDKIRLPQKIGLSEEENTKFDLYRLEYISQALNILIKYFGEGKSLFKSGYKPISISIDEGIYLNYSRTILYNITKTIDSLSGRCRGEYEFLLASGSRWKALEALGGLMVPKSGQDFILNLFEYDKLTEEIKASLYAEIKFSDRIIEAAIPDIINNDLPKLRKVINNIYLLTKQGKSICLKEVISVELPAIKALTLRITDTFTLMKLLQHCLSHFQEIQKKTLVNAMKLPSFSLSSMNKSQIKESSIDNNDTYINLSTKQGLHAALRRLQKIGELLTNKNLSSQLKQLDPLTDWDAFINIRNSITHQYKEDLKAKINNKLLKDSEFFESILTIEMEELYIRIINLIVIRAQQFPKCSPFNPMEFWNNLYHYKNNNLNQYDTSISKEDRNIFLKTLLDTNAPFEIRKEWINIFINISAGRYTKEPNRIYLKYLLISRNNEPLYLQCKQIAEKVINLIRENTSKTKIKKTKIDDSKEAIVKRKEIKREKKEHDRISKLQGLDVIRKLSLELMWSSEKSLLSREQHIDSAVEAITNIKEFIEQNDFIATNFHYEDFNAWVEALGQENIELFIEKYYILLRLNPELSDAIEYNAGQLLKFLEQIKDYPEVKCYEYLFKRFDLLRRTRNYIEHGNFLQDNPPRVPDKYPLTHTRQYEIGMIMLVLIFELLPALKLIKEQVAINSQVPEETLHLINNDEPTPTLHIQDKDQSPLHMAQSTLNLQSQYLKIFEYNVIHNGTLEQKVDNSFFLVGGLNKLAPKIFYNVAKLINIITPLSQSIRRGIEQHPPFNIKKEDDYFSYLSSELMTRIIMYLPESNSFHHVNIESLLENLKEVRIPNRNHVNELLKSKPAFENGM
ncbi:hypothetical protein H1Q59_06950 [Holosporaceae bacterium 'Namur']|nr:hypothetical protein [Holosporaceae bacterium 'Namur']